jgi:hypothetical protein
MSSGPTKTCCEERGTVTLLIVGFAVVLLMGVGVVIDASAAYLQRQGLDTVADGAALAGADAGSRNLGALYGEGIGSRVRLAQAEAAAREAVSDFLRQTGAPGKYPGLRVSVHLDPAEQSVVVDVHAPLELPLTVPGSPHRATVGASGSAAVLLDR